MQSETHTKTKRIEYMATNNYTVHNEKTSFPQRRRGQIKAQIFSSMVEFVASIFSKDEKDKDDNNNDGGYFEGLSLEYETCFYHVPFSTRALYRGGSLTMFSVRGIIINLKKHSRLFLFICRQKLLL
ncbi:hypothetical protein HKD37_11G031350 [Glycine soja]